VELDFLTCVTSERSSEIDEILDRSGVDVRNGREIEDDSSEKGFALVLFLLDLFELGTVTLLLPSVRSGVVPGSVTLRSERVILTVSGGFFGVVLDLVRKVRSVDVNYRGEEDVRMGVAPENREEKRLTESFFHSEDDDSLGRSFNDYGSVLGGNRT